MTLDSLALLNHINNSQSWSWIPLWVMKHQAGGLLKISRKLQMIIHMFIISVTKDEKAYSYKDKTITVVVEAAILKSASSCLIGLFETSVRFNQQ